MNNKPELLGLLANIFAVILLLCFIVLGLNRIGIYSLPEPIERLLGTYDNADGIGKQDDEIYDSMKFDDSIVEFKSVEIDYGNAMAVLGELSAAQNYSQQIIVKHYFDNDIRSESMKILRKNGNFDITISDMNGNKHKHISEQGDVVKIETFDSSKNSFVSEFEKGKFDISDECGFVLTVEQLLESQSKLDESAFSINETEDDIYMSIAFDSELYGIKQRMTYSISLGYGIVTDVMCYEGDELVYSMETEVVSKEN